MTTVTDNTTLGIGIVQRQAFLILFDNLNAAITEQNTLWAQNDLDFAAHTSRSIAAIVLEEVEPENFHEGHNPGLIEGPTTWYPNCSVLVERWALAPEDAVADQWDSRQLMLGIELMAKSEVSPNEANQRVMRMADAVNAVISSNRTLGGAVQEVVDSGNGFLTAINPRLADTSYGKEWYWQGARLNYTVKKESPRAAPSGPFFPESFEIDQA